MDDAKLDAAWKKASAESTRIITDAVHDHAFDLVKVSIGILQAMLERDSFDMYHQRFDGTRFVDLDEAQIGLYLCDVDATYGVATGGPGEPDAIDVLLSSLIISDDFLRDAYDEDDEAVNHAEAERRFAAVERSLAIARKRWTDHNASR
jgi:hypothetical protein